MKKCRIRCEKIMPLRNSMLLLIIFLLLAFALTAVPAGAESLLINPEDSTGEEFITYDEHPDYSLEVPASWMIDDQDMPRYIVFARRDFNSDFADNLNVIREEDVQMSAREYYQANLNLLQEFMADFELIEEEESVLDGQKAYEMIYHGQEDLKFHQLLTVYEERGYVLTFTSTEEDFQEHIDLLERMIESFTFKEE